MKIISYNQGCENQVGCFGPDNPYWTVFNTQLDYLRGHIFLSIILGIGLFSFLSYLNKKNKLKTNRYINLIISVIFAIIFFFLIAYFFPVIVKY